MARLGEFGQIREQTTDVFGYFTEDIRVNPDLSELDVLDFMEAAAEIDEEDPAAVKILKNFLRSLLHADDFDRFWELSRTNRQSVADLMTVAKAIVEAVAKRPTSVPSDSSVGRHRIAVTSQDRSFERVLERLNGRSDLQLIHVQAAEARQPV
jgi:hypothetical protein